MTMYAGLVIISFPKIYLGTIKITFANHGAYGAFGKIKFIFPFVFVVHAINQ